MLPEVIHLSLKFRILLSGPVFFFQIQNERHQRFSNITPAEFTEAAIRVRPFIPGIA